MVGYAEIGYSAGTVVADRSNYWRYYGLRRDPFTAGLKDDEFYMFPRWEQYVDLLQYLCHSSNVLLAVTGTKGSGKTTFLRHFVDRISENTRICQLSASPLLDANQLCTALTKEFALPSCTADALEDQLDTHLANLQHSPELCLLVIDNAHRLPKDTLQALLYLVRQQSESQMRLHILIFGIEGLKDSLTGLAEAEGERELFHHLPLEPLKLEETKAYLKHRMAAAGLPAALPLSSTSISRIHSLTEGIPGRINAVTRQVLIDGMKQEPSLGWFVEFVKERQALLLGGGILLLILVLAAFFLARDSHYPMSLTPIVTIEQAGSKQLMAKVLTISQRLHHAAAIKPVMQSTQSAMEADQQQPAMVNQVTTIIEPTPNGPVSLSNVDSANVIPSAVPQADVAATPAPTVMINTASSMSPVQPVQSSLPTQAVVSKAMPQAEVTKPMPQAAVSKPIPQVQMQPMLQATAQPAMVKPAPQLVMPTAQQLPAKAVTTPSVVNADVSMPAVVNTKVAAHKNTPPVVANDKIVYLHDTQQLLTANPHHYTVQLIGLSKEAELKEFIATNHLGNNTASFHGYRQGKDWYTLVYGQYATSAEAAAAIQKLPEAVRSLHPWVRTFASVQLAMHATGHP